MRVARSLVIYLAAVFIGGALVAPWLYFGAQHLAPHSGLAREPFHRYVDRSLLGLALIGLWPLLGAHDLWDCRRLGFAGFAARRKEAGLGFAFGWAAVLAAFLPAIVCQARLPIFGHGHAVGYFVGAVVTALIVSMLEEILFRGALFGILRQAMDWRWAALISSVIYAAAHFLKKAELPGPVTWHSGLELLPLMARALVDKQTMIPAFLNLTLIGAALALAYQRTGALYASVALHGALIFWLRFFLFLTQPARGARVWLWGGDDPLSGWLAVPILAAMVCLAACLRPLKSND